ncbi:MAG: DUF6580 family putative transport protein [Bacteroidota bacterium]
MNKTLLNSAVFALLVGIIVLGRVVTHLPNFAPVIAAGLFAAYFFRNRLLALAVPLTGMLIGDVFFVGTYDLPLMIAVYLGLCAPVLIGQWIGHRDARMSAKKRLKTQGGKTILAAVGGSTFFFLISNLAVFFFGGIYALTVKGLVLCFTFALPFYKFSLAGDLFYSAVIFGGYWVTIWALERRKAKREATA